MATAVEERWQTKIKCISEGVHHVFNTKEFSDVTFRVQGRTFKAHKLILASRSSELASLVFGQNAPDDFPVDGTTPVTANGFQIFLRFLYTSELDAPDKISVIEAYQCAHFYQQRALKKKCIREIQTWELTPADILDLFGKKWDIPALKARCTAFLESKGEEVISSSRFLKASDETVAAILETGGLKNVPPMRLIERIMDWGKKYLTATSNYSVVREKLLDTDPPLLGMLGIEKLKGNMLPKIIKSYPGLLTDGESTKFMLYFHTKESSSDSDEKLPGLPSWCIAKD